MKRFAVIFEGSPFDRKGQFNAVHNRVKHLLMTGQCEIDVYCIHSRDNAFTRHVRHTPNTPDVAEIIIEDVKYRLLWYRFSIMDHLSVEKFNKRPVFFRRFINKKVTLLRGYDAVIAHSFTGGLFAYEAYVRFGVPYFANWHGSDVHTHPWRVGVILEDTRKIMENAKCNFFVSSNLLEQSSEITCSAEKKVLYNGVSEEFKLFSQSERTALRNFYSLGQDDVIVAFVGTLNKVKNVTVLPEIYSKVKSSYHGNVRFWIVGDGKLRSELEHSFSDFEVKFFGNVSSDQMPSIMNCVNVLVLPSLNEGLPLVCAEAISCGANAIGSDVGGIAEVVGAENVVPHGEDFAQLMAQRVVEMLSGDIVQILPSYISWQSTASEELAYLLG